MLARALAGGKTLSPNWILVLVGVSVFLGALDQTMVVSLIPDMIKGLNIPQDRFYLASWIVNGYILGYTAVMPLMGRVSDVYGHARIHALALVVFMVGSLAVALSPNLTLVVVFRAVQAMGAGALVPTTIALVADHLPLERRALGIGAAAAASEAG